MRLLLALGVLGGASWLAYAFVPPECVPVTAASEIFCARLWTPALFGMTAGFVGLYRWLTARTQSSAAWGVLLAAAGAAVMTVGNGAEYWLFSTWPHEGPDGWLRGTLFVSFLLGWLGVLLGSIGAGVVLLARRHPTHLRILGSLSFSIASFTLFFGLLAVGALALVTSLYALLASRRTGAGAGTSEPPAPTG